MGWRNIGAGYGANGYWWTSTEADSVSAYRRRINDNHDDAKEYELNKNFGFSVRCVQDG